ncbi:MAG: hypothetical protein Q9216_002034 [Gyalolechia sp. 2 TL-2023]
MNCKERRLCGNRLAQAHYRRQRAGSNMGVVVQGSEPVQADLVFVHGLRGDRIRTWEVDKVFWPRDLLPAELPNARIMSYGYDVDVMNFFSNASQSSIFQHALNLLEDLQRKRKTAGEKRRPIIFIGHSLGCLVIKDALCRSHEYKSNGRNPRATAIIGFTYGIAFLGTPHRGGNHTSWAKIATNFATVVLKDHNAKVIDAFTKDDDSATLGLSCERKQWIPANHSDMCKFKNTQNHGYERVAGGNADLVEDAVEAAARNDVPIDTWVNVDQH